MLRNVVYHGIATAVPCNYFKNSIFLIEYVAFFECKGGVNIFLHSTTPKGFFHCTFLHIFFLSQINLWQLCRTYQTVYDLWPHLHLLLFANLQSNKKAHRPIFPNLIYIIRAVSSFLIPLCSCRILVPEVRTRVWRRVLLIEALSHFLSYFLFTRLA